MPDGGPHPYVVHAVGDSRYAHRVEGASFEDAAMTFVELWVPDAAGDLDVIVEDADSGRRCCYRVDLGGGETGPCR